VTLKSLRDGQAHQQRHSLADVASWAASLLPGSDNQGLA
jgi:hypothetical protein